jgi:hypothetical protein
MIKVISFGISYQDYYRCVHPEYPIKEVKGFKITSTKKPNILEIRFYDQHFDITVDVLRSSWAGCFIFLRHGYLRQLLQTLTGKVPTLSMQNGSRFSLRNASVGYVIKGTCCGHKTLTSDAQLEDCWEGGILLAEYQRVEAVSPALEEAIYWVTVARCWQACIKEKSQCKEASWNHVSAVGYCVLIIQSFE